MDRRYVPEGYYPHICDRYFIHIKTDAYNIGSYAVFEMYGPSVDDDPRFKGFEGSRVGFSPHSDLTLKKLIMTNSASKIPITYDYPQVVCRYSRNNWLYPRQLLLLLDS